MGSFGGAFRDNSTSSLWVQQSPFPVCTEWLMDKGSLGTAWGYFPEIRFFLILNNEAQTEGFPPEYSRIPTGPSVWVSPGAALSTGRAKAPLDSRLPGQSAAKPKDSHREGGLLPENQRDK